MFNLGDSSRKIKEELGNGEMGFSGFMVPSNRFPPFPTGNSSLDIR